MGTGISELSMTQLAALGRYNNVIFFNDPSDTDLLKTIAGHPRTILINLGQFLNIASGEIQGDALAADELAAAQIAAGAVDTSELAAGCLSADAGGRAKMATGVFDAATALDKIAANALVGSLIPTDATGHFDLPEQAGSKVNVAFDTGSPADLLSADSSNDRLVFVLAVATIAPTGSPEWDVGSETTATDGLFNDLAAGAWVVGERWMGVIMLPATEKLQVTLTTPGSAGAIDFYVIPLTITHADASITDAKLASSIVKEPGRIACGRADFAGVATPAITVTIGAVVYQEADAEDFTNGVWTNGATANDSAVSLAAAINGDTRNAGAGTYAAVVLTDTVFIFSLAVGTAGNVAIVVSAGEPAVVENLIDGAAAAVKQVVTIMHTVTAAEVAVAGAAPEVLIPLPFDPSYFSWQVYDSNGGLYDPVITARGTVTAASSPVPAYFKLANNGATDVQAGDIIRLVVVE